MTNSSSLISLFAKSIMNKAFFRDFAYFFDLLGPKEAGGVTEVCVNPGKYGSVAGYFDNVQKALSEIKQYDGKENLFITLNPCQPGLLARGYNRTRATCERNILKAKRPREKTLIEFCSF